MKVLLAVLAVVLAALFVVRGTADGDSAGTGGEGTGTASGGSLGSRCSVFADVPVVDHGGRVTGPARYRCGKPDGGVDVTVFLQLKAGGSWSNVDGQPMAATGAETTRDRAERDRSARATGPCVPGGYRTFVRGTVSNGERSWPVEAISDAVTIACGATPSGSQTST